MKRIYLEGVDIRVLHIVREDSDYFVCPYVDGQWRIGYVSNDNPETLIAFGGPTAEEDARDALRAIGVLLGMEEKA